MGAASGGAAGGARTPHLAAAVALIYKNDSGLDDLSLGLSAAADREREIQQLLPKLFNAFFTAEAR